MAHWPNRSHGSRQVRKVPESGASSAPACASEPALGASTYASEAQTIGTHHTTLAIIVWLVMEVVVQCNPWAHPPAPTVPENVYPARAACCCIGDGGGGERATPTRFACHRSLSNQSRPDRIPIKQHLEGPHTRTQAPHKARGSRPVFQTQEGHHQTPARRARPGNPGKATRAPSNLGFL